MSAEIIQFAASRVRAAEHVSPFKPSPDSDISERRSPPRNEVEVSETCRNLYLRKDRNKAWWQAEAVTTFRRARMDFESALQVAQRNGLPEGNYHGVIAADRSELVTQWREALVRQMLTPAPDLRAVTWKKRQLENGQYRHIGAKSERLERAIECDLAFLAAHPVRRTDKPRKKPGPKPKGLAPIA